MKVDDKIVLTRVLQILKEWRETPVVKAGNFQRFLLQKLGHVVTKE